MKSKSQLYHKKYHLRQLCCDDISLIENYEKAINSDERWDCHHRLETHFSDGTPRPLNAQLTQEELEALGIYWKRPASELILLPFKEHTSLHITGHTQYEMTDDIKKQISSSVRSNPEAMGGKAKRMREAYKKDNQGLSWNEFQHKFKNNY